MRHLSFLYHCARDGACVKSLQPAALISILKPSNLRRCSLNPQRVYDEGQKATERRERNGQHYQVPGCYTPNNRCRTEAPLTSLPKLTPVKNDEDSKGEGGKEEQNKIKKKNHKRQKQGDGV